MEHPVSALFDANILYPAPLRDFFLRLAQEGLVRARWTERIHDEWTRNVLKNSPHVSAERIARTRMLMNEAVRDCLISGYEDLIDSIDLPDPDDRHVVAAAIHWSADVIVTLNLKDFPAPALSHYDIQAIHPDDFLLSLLEHSPDSVTSALKRQREGLRNPPKSVEELLSTLENQGLRQSVGRLRGFVELI